jgi:hypothetical protein
VGYHVEYFPPRDHGPLRVGDMFHAYDSQDEAKVAILEDMARRLDLDLDVVKKVELAYRRYKIIDDGPDGDRFKEEIARRKKELGVEE